MSPTNHGATDPVILDAVISPSCHLARVVHDISFYQEKYLPARSGKSVSDMYL